MLTQPGTKYAVIVGLILVAMGAIAFAVHALTAPSSRPGQKGSRETHYWCDKCLKEYTMKPGDFWKQTPDEEAVGGDLTATRRPHCLLCGAKHAGWLMAQCPQCEKYHLPGGVRPGEADDQQTGDTCPHCGTDRAEWFRKKFPKGRKRQR